MGPFWKTALEIVLKWLVRKLQFWTTGTTTGHGMSSRLILMTVRLSLVQKTGSVVAFVSETTWER
jgi:hypothetical protein